MGHLIRIVESLEDNLDVIAHWFSRRLPRNSLNIPQRKCETRRDADLWRWRSIAWGFTIDIWSHSENPEKKLPLLLLVIMGIAGPAAAVYNKLDASLECEKIKQRIERIHSKMRAGYTRAQGEKMEAELRRLRALRARACR